MSGQSTINESISIKLNESVGSATISPSGRDVCLAARKGLFIVDLDDPWATPRFLPYYSAIVSDVQWSPHPARAHWVVSTSGNKGLVWNLAAPSGSSPIEHVTLGHERSITDMNWAVFQPDILATCGIDGNVLAYDLRLGGRKPILKYCGWRHGATQVKYNRQNPNELASSHGEYLYIWDDRKGSHPVTTIRAHEQKIYGIDYSRKKKDSIVTCSLDHTVKYWSLNGLETIEEPTQVINTSSPVWRARHTPFGNGLVTLPQRSDHSVKIWSQDAPDKEVWKLSGHTDVVREFLWRTQGGNDPNNDDRVFQLVTWGNDQQLLLTPIPQETLASVGHVPHSPIEVRQTRRHASNLSYREPASLPKTSSPYPQGSLPGASPLGHSGPGVSPTTHMSSHITASSSSDDHYGKSKMTPPGLYSSHGSSVQYPSNRYSLTSASRYGRSATSGASMSSSDAHSPLLGTSPANGRGLYLTDRRVDHVPAIKTAEHGKPYSHLQAENNAGGTGTFMTRTTGRKPGGQDAVSWMEGVRVVSSKQDGPPPTAKLDYTSAKSRFGHEAYGEYTTNHAGAGPAFDKDVVPLHEELTAIARALQSKVRFEKIAIPTRTLIVALYGPWAASGVSTFLRATFTFPPEYPQLPLNIDIERSSSISNKARARILAGVRGLAARYANKCKNSLEACLNCLMGGKVVEPDNLDEEDGLMAAHGELSNFLVQRLNDGEEEVDEVDSEEDLVRLIANRNCPSPRRAGAVFSPRGVLFCFHPLDSVSHIPNQTEKRGRSASPHDSRANRPRRRRLFESFGIIPSLQTETAEDLEEEEELFQNGHDEDSDDVLNIPSLVMAKRRGRSHNGSESVGTSQHLNIPLAGTGRVFNSRIYRHDYSSIVNMDTSLALQYTLQGDLLNIVTTNTELAKANDCSWLVRRAWSSLLGLAEASAGSTDENMPIRALFLGESMPEKVFMDILDVFFRLGDVQMTGILACLVELDRRTIQASRPIHSRRFSRSPAAAGAVDYFSLKPVRAGRGSGGPPGTASSDYRPSAITPSGLGLPLKSPKDWISTSYGTQGSSAGSSTRGSSWANNLSTFFKSSASAGEKAGFHKNGGHNTPPSVGTTGQPTHPSLSPAFVKRTTLGPLSEVRKQGGIASGRPLTVTGKPRAVTHVSFAKTSHLAQANVESVPQPKSPARKSSKIVVRKFVSGHDSRPPSMLLHPQVQAQLELYRFMYADLLHRLELPHQRAQVLKLTRSVLENNNKPVLRLFSGLSINANEGLSLDRRCLTCGNPLKGRSPAYCNTCRQKRDAVPCAICHLPLHGLTETCLACLHTCHLACLQDWRADEVVCPAACGCSCTDISTEEPMSASFSEVFKSPPIVT